MSKADEMFGKLGYKTVNEYSNGIEYIYSTDDDFTQNGGNALDDCIAFFIYGNDTKRIIIDKFYDAITMQELQAINEKVKELGWNE